MKNANTKHHIVPQSYLKRFARRNTNNDGYNIGVNQLGSNKKFIDAIKNVAFKNDYYAVTNREDSKYWEKYFADKIEILYGVNLTNIIATIMLSNERENVLSDMQRKCLAKMAVFQILRVPGFLERRFEHGKQLFDEAIEETLQLFNEVDRITIQSTLAELIRDKEIFIKDAHIPLIAEEESLDFLSRVLNNKVWLIYFNDSSIPFITSDSPVVMYNIESKSFSYADNGIGKKETFTYYPLTSKILLQMIPKNYDFAKFKNKDNSLIILSNEHIPFINSVNRFQLNHAENQIFVHPNYINYLERL